jgi:hypothetical protein
VQIRKFIFIPLFLAMLAPRCQDSDVKSIAENLNRAAIAIDTAQSTVISAHEEGIINKNSADSVVVITVRVAYAIRAANVLTREFSELSEESRDHLLEILIPVLGALEDGLSNENLNIITNANVKSSVEISLRTALVALQTVQGFLKVRGATEGGSIQ